MRRCVSGLLSACKRRCRAANELLDEPRPSTMNLDSNPYRKDFPILSRQVHGKPLVYFDNANTSQKPQVVIDTVDRFYRETNANVARAVHSLGEAATSAYEGARDKLARFINAPTRDEVIFTS